MEILRSYPLPLKGWELKILALHGGYAAAATSPSGDVCTLIEGVTANYSVDDYKADAERPEVTSYTGGLTGLHGIETAPAKLLILGDWTAEDVEDYADYLASFGIDIADPAEDSFRDVLISYADGSTTIEKANAAVADWVALISEAVIPECKARN